MNPHQSHLAKNMEILFLSLTNLEIFFLHLIPFTWDIVTHLEELQLHLGLKKKHPSKRPYGPVARQLFTISFALNWSIEANPELQSILDRQYNIYIRHLGLKVNYY